MVNPFIGLYSIAIGIPIETLGIVFTSEYLTSVVVRLPSAGLANRYGRKNMMALGGFAFATGILVYLLIPNLTALVAGSILRGLGWSLFQPSILSLMVDMRGMSTRREEKVSIISMGPAVAMTVGPALGGFLFIIGSYNMIFAGSVLAGVASLLVTFVVVRDDGIRDRSSGFITGEVKRLREIMERNFTLTLGTRLFMSYILASIIIFVPIFSVEKIGFQKEEVGVLFSVAALLNVLSRFMVGKISGVIGEKRIMVGGLLVGTASVATCGFAESREMVWTAMILYGLAAGLFIPAGISYVGRTIPVGSLTIGMAAYSLMIDVGFTVGSTVSAIIFPFGGFRIIFLIAAGLGVIGAIAQQLTKLTPRSSS